MQTLTGNEEFTLHGTSAGISVKDFWSWAYSDLLDNTQRGVMAEFLVYSSIRSTPPPDSQMRENWLPFDVTSPSGRRIEVKSAAYIQPGHPKISLLRSVLTLERNSPGIMLLPLMHLRQNATATCMCSAFLLP